MYRYYALCRANIGRVARIGTRDGRIFDGRISGVTPTHVYLTIDFTQSERHHQKRGASFLKY
ncbi:hypothetical protein J2S00_002511 [Caldalkalibacillus uzonensis]|uniref:Uncharacterized protein n=1 Tax=Caldalkalibacillus uzonensis TaxID=353224 RepID=A0ABU0CTG1_9BACI|nr:hypothetical protein [Caldalkalibacillus uzonensis]